MKLKALVAGMAFVAMTQSAMAAEPTRGFLLEKGATAALGNASIDTAIGEETSIAARVGLGEAELLLSQGNVGSNVETGAVLKLALKEVQGLAVYAGLSHYDTDTYVDSNNGYSYLNLKAGAAFTVNVEQFDLTANAELVLDDAADESYINIGAGAFLNLAKTAYGTFKPGIEVVASTYDDKDTIVVAGVRWEYSNRLTIDALPFQFADSDTFAMPGMVVVNLAF